MPRGKKSTPADASTPSARDRLIRSAIETIADLGWRGATTRAIAQRAGVNLALVNYHFGSKRDLLMAAFTSTLELIADMMSPDALVADPAAILGAATAMLENAPNDPHMRVVFEATLQAPSDSEIRDVTGRFLAAYREQLARALAGGHAPSARHRGRATAIAALMDGLFLHMLIDPSVSPRAAIESVQRLVE